MLSVLAGMILAGPPTPRVSAQSENQPPRQTTQTQVSAGLSASSHSPATPLRGVRDVFPFGVYASGNGPVPTMAAAGASLEDQIDALCRDLRAHNFDTVWINNLSAEFLPLWLAKGREHGIRMVPQGGGMPMYLLNQGWWESRWESAIETQVKPFYEALANEHRHDPSLLAYSIVEEIPPDSPFFPHIADITVRVAHIDPHHPVIVLYNRATSAERAAREIQPEVIGYDCYPFFTNSRSGPVSHHAQRSYYERQIARFSRAAASVDAQLWIMAQSWGRTAASDEADPADRGMRPPTLAEMRYQVWAALFHGARGIFFYAYASGAEPNRQGYYDEHFLDHEGRPLPHYGEAARISRRLDPVKPLLLRLRPQADVEVVYWENLEQLHGRTFVHEVTGDRYLMAFNADVERDQPIDIEFGYFPHYLAGTDRFHDVLSGVSYEGRDLRKVVLPSGSGRLFLIGGPEAWERHLAWEKTTGNDR
ncbi:MAG: hypothetical protein VX255_03615 [Candidatus Latescibacterota bacterium]|nr:hypothetical protein [Candidatus Latescibacterota bacterium]